MTSDAFAEFCREMTTSPMSQISVVVRFVCREGRPMPRSHPIMWIAQSCSSPSASTAPKRLTLTELLEQSNIRAFHMHHPRTTTSSQRRGDYSALPVLSVEPV